MLEASLTVVPSRASRPEELRAECVLQNAGDAPTEIDSTLLSSPSLALEIEQEDGEPVLLPPPPVPSERERVTLEPGERYEAQFTSFLPSWTDAGTYRARLRYVASEVDRVVSPWVEFVVGTS